jgi:DNA-binding MarR family transcriptional regulator
LSKALNRILHQPVRTRIVAHLVAEGSCEYTRLKKELNLSDGHMTTHMKELLEHGYVSFEKTFVDNKPRTTYQLTTTGRAAFADYIKSLKKIIMLAE